MPINKKSQTNTKPKKSASNTPRITPKQAGVAEKKLIDLHKRIEQNKALASALKDDATREDLLDYARDNMFNARGGSFHVDLPDGKSLLVKPSSRVYPINEVQQDAIDKILTDEGEDINDYYHETQSITLDADRIYDRLDEDDYSQFQADLAEFMSDRKLGDCWSMSTSVSPKSDWPTKRLSLPPSVNLEIEKIKPTVISLEAKRTLKEE